MNYSELVQLNKLREKAKEKGRQDIVDEINELFASVEEEPSYLSREDRMLAGEQRAEAEHEQYQELRKTAGYRKKKPAAQEPQQPEQEEEQEQRMAAENLQLNESKTQWSLDGEILDRLASEGAMVRSDLGTLPYDPESIYKIAEVRMKYLDQNLLELFTATKSLSDNINLYITEAERSDAIGHGQKAVDDTAKVAETLQSEIKNDK